MNVATPAETVGSGCHPCGHRLFDADRVSLITATVLEVVREFGIETSQLHNDSTTISVTGNYLDADGRTRGGQPTPAIRHESRRSLVSTDPSKWLTACRGAGVA